MADMSFDIVTVGAGNKALMASMYLTKYGGLSVGMFEERHEAGAGWSSEEGASPGFVGNQCSHQYTDLEWYFGMTMKDFPEWDVTFHQAKLNVGTTFPDETWFGTYNSRIDYTGEKTAAIIEKFGEEGKRDAESWMWIMDKAQNYWRPAILEWSHSAEPVFGALDAVEMMVFNPDSGIEPVWPMMSLAELCQEFFRSPKLQSWLVAMAQSMGMPPFVNAMGMGGIFILAVSYDSIVVQGGNHQLAHASQRVVANNGGRIFYESPVEKILVKNGRATGVRLADGTEVEARKAVLSNGDPYDLCHNLLGPELVSERILRGTANLMRDWTTISWYTWALHEHPKYTAAEWDPDIQMVPWNYMRTGYFDEFMEECWKKKLGMWPSTGKMGLVAADHSVYDPSRAPEGKAAVLTEVFVLPATAMSEKEWKEMEKKHAQETLDVWQQFAPNMTWDNVIGYQPVTPFFTSKHSRTWGPTGNWNSIDQTPAQFGRNRPIPELNNYKVPGIENLYCAGAAWHPGSGAHECQAYIIYKIMAEEMGLRKPWDEQGRDY